MNKKQENNEHFEFRIKTENMFIKQLEKVKNDNLAVIAHEINNISNLKERLRLTIILKKVMSDIIVKLDDITKELII